jgi:hypothetical protein
LTVLDLRAGRRLNQSLDGRHDPHDDAIKWKAPNAEIVKRGVALGNSVREQNT